MSRTIDQILWNANRPAGGVRPSTRPTIIDDLNELSALTGESFTTLMNSTWALVNNEWKMIQE